MFYKLAIDLKGHLVEIEGKWDTRKEILHYLHTWYNSYKDLNTYIIEYENLGEDPVYGEKYIYNLDKYYACEDGVYYEEHYNEIDQGTGTKEIGNTYLVNIDLLPLSLKNDGELVELAIEKWFNSMNNSIPKPIWLI